MSTQWNIAITIFVSIVELKIVQGNPTGHCTAKCLPLSSLPHPGICPFSSYCVFITPTHPVISWQSLCGWPDVCFGKNAHFLPLCIAQCPQLLLCAHSLANPLLVDEDPKITQAGMRKPNSSVCIWELGGRILHHWDVHKRGREDGHSHTHPDLCFPFPAECSKPKWGKNLSAFLSLQI